jgi:hypothetical protein
MKEIKNPEYLKFNDSLLEYNLNKSTNEIYPCKKYIFVKNF